MLRMVRDAGGNRTHLNRFATGGLAIWLQRQCKILFKATVQGFEPCSAVLEAARSPRSTPS